MPQISLFPPVKKIKTTRNKQKTLIISYIVQNWQNNPGHDDQTPPPDLPNYCIVIMSYHFLQVFECNGSCDWSKVRRIDCRSQAIMVPKSS